MYSTYRCIMYLRVTGNFFKLFTLDLRRKEADIDELILLRFHFAARSLHRMRPVIRQCSCPSVMRVDTMVCSEAEHRTQHRHRTLFWNLAYLHRSTALGLGHHV